MVPGNSRYVQRSPRLLEDTIAPINICCSAACKFLRDQGPAGVPRPKEKAWSLLELQEVG